MYDRRRERSGGGKVGLASPSTEQAHLLLRCNIVLFKLTVAEAHRVTYGHASVGGNEADLAVSTHSHSDELGAPAVGHRNHSEAVLRHAHRSHLAAHTVLHRHEHHLVACHEAAAVGGLEERRGEGQGGKRKLLKVLANSHSRRFKL